jgi:serine/threonine protein kinase
MPPEALQSDTFDPSMADVWSFGLLFCLILTHDRPNEWKNHLHRTVENGFAMAPIDSWRLFTECHQLSDDCKQLMDRILVVKAVNRIKIDELLEDNYFNEALRIHINLSIQ